MREVPQDLHVADWLPFNRVQLGQSFAMGVISVEMQ
jgi:hypothetical protein